MRDEEQAMLTGLAQEGREGGSSRTTQTPSWDAGWMELSERLGIEGDNQVLGNWDAESTFLREDSQERISPHQSK